MNRSVSLTNYNTASAVAASWMRNTTTPSTVSLPEVASTNGTDPNSLRACQILMTTNSLDRFGPDNAALLLVDHQTGLANVITDQSIPEFRTAVLALAKTGKLFNLPTVITTSAADGPSGPVLLEITSILPEEPMIHRSGEIKTWDNAEFVAAVEANGAQEASYQPISSAQHQLSALEG